MTCEIINFDAAKKKLAKKPSVNKKNTKPVKEAETKATDWPEVYLNEDGEEVVDLYICNKTGYLMSKPNDKCKKITFLKEDCPKDLDEYNHALDVLLGDW
jgi:hypothetical protein